jgi:hypothetical protein
VKGNFNKDNHHLADVLEYLPTNVQNNANGEVERIVLIVNTYREKKDPRSRNHKDDFTQPTREIAENNGVCYLRTYDLYRLWLDYLDESRSSSEIFEEVFNRVQLLLSPTANPIPRVPRNLAVSMEIYHRH